MACCPYGTPRNLLCAQLYTGFLVIFTIFGWWLSWIFGIATFIMIMMPACKQVNRKLFKAAQTCAGVAATCEFLYSALVTFLGARIWCHGDRKHCNLAPIRIFAIISAILWIADAALIEVATRDLFGDEVVDENATNNKNEGNNNPAAVAPTPPVVTGVLVPDQVPVVGSNAKNDIEMGNRGVYQTYVA